MHARTYVCVIRQGLLFELGTKNSSVEIVLFKNRKQSKLYKNSNPTIYLSWSKCMVEFDWISYITLIIWKHNRDGLLKNYSADKLEFHIDFQMLVSSDEKRRVKYNTYILNQQDATLGSICFY